MTVTWSDLVEQPPDRVGPPGARTDRSTVDVVGFDRHVVAEPDQSGIALVRDTLAERFSGGIEGRGEAEHLRCVRPDGSTTFVGVERITGTVAGRAGSLSLTCHGTAGTDGVVHGVWHVVPGSGTGELAGLRGRGEFVARQQDGRWHSADAFTHWYEP